MALGYKTDRCKLGNVYTNASRELMRRGWRRKKTDQGRFHMMFGEMDGAGIPFKRFAQCFRYDYGIKPLVNHYRGTAMLGRRTQLRPRTSGRSHACDADHGA